MASASIFRYVDGIYVDNYVISGVVANYPFTISSPASGTVFSAWSEVTVGSGWKYSTSGNTITFSKVANTTCSLNIYFVSTAPASYTVSFDANGGSVSPSRKSCTAGSSLTTPSPTRSGYSCDGWYTSASGGTKRCAAGGSYTPSCSETLYAQWTKLTKYTVSYDKNGGSSQPDPQTGYSGDVITLADAISKTLYNFAGWKIGSVVYAAGDQYTITGSVIAVAQWTKKTIYTLSYDANGGSSTPSGQTGSSGDSVTLAGAISRDGYSFSGWKIGSTVYAAGSTYTFASANATAVAQWTALPTYTLTYDANGGSPTPSSQSGYSGSSVTLAGEIEKDLCDFAGWKIGSEVYAAGDPYTLTSDATAVAQWSDVSTHVVTFVKNADDVTGSAIPSILVTDGSSVTLPNAELWVRENYAFAGWCTDSGCTGTVYAAGDTYTPTADTPMYAKWSSTEGQGARADYERHQTSSTYQTKVTDQYNLQISTDVPVGALLTWDRILNGKIVVKHSTYNPTYNPNPSVTTTTQREQDAVTRTYATVPAHGSASPFLTVNLPGDSIRDWTYQSTKASSEYYTVTETTKTTSFNDAMKLIAPELTNYEFAGWYTLDQSYLASVGISDSMFTTLVSKNREVSFSLDVQGKLNWVRYNNQSGTGYDVQQYLNYLRMKYLGVKVLVLFDANGGVLDDFYREVRYAQAYGSLPTPTWEGHTFDGWYTAAEGGTLVTAATVVSTGTEHILYAHWTASAGTYKLYFDAAGGTCSESVRTVTEGAAYGTLPTPARSGYSFLGWFTSGGTEVTAATVAGDEDTVVYAHWRGAACTVTFDANGGTCSETTRTVYAGATVGSLPTATKSGCKFGGWFTTDGTQANASTVVTASITLTARWNAESSTRIIVRYKIKLTLNGGTLDASYECKYTRGYAKALPTASEITRAGYTFGGWYAKEDFSGSAATEIPSSSSGTQKFYAKWN